MLAIEANGASTAAIAILHPTVHRSSTNLLRERHRGAGSNSAEVGDGAEGYLVKDVAAAGGWKTEEVLVTSYRQGDAEMIKKVVSYPTHRIASR